MLIHSTKKYKWKFYLKHTVKIHAHAELPVTEHIHGINNMHNGFKPHQNEVSRTSLFRSKKVERN